MLKKYVKQKGVKMYHIKNDKRAITSAELIYDGLCQCLNKKSYTQITISDIQKASTVSRATFYRHFDTIDDILYWRCNQAFEEMFSLYVHKENATIYDFAQHFINYWTNNSSILEVLMQINRIDILYTCHTEHMHLFQKTSLNAAQILQKDSAYFMGIRTGILIGIFMTWLKNGKKESPDELFEIIKTQFEFIYKSELIV